MKYIQLKNQLGGECKCGNKAKSIEECNICSQRVTSSSAAASSSAAMPAVMGNAVPAVMGNAMPAAVGNAGDINVNVDIMRGERVQLQISPNATILQLKELLHTKSELKHPEIYRQKLVFRPGPNGMDALSDNVILRDIGIANNMDDDTKFDLLFEPNLLNFSFEITERIRALLRNNRKDELTDLLSQYAGSLYLGHSKITDAKLALLADALKENTSITVLTLNDNKFSDEGVALLVDALEGNTTLTYLSLKNNMISNKSAELLAKLLKVNTTIDLLDIDQKEMIESYKYKDSRINRRAFLRGYAPAQDPLIIIGSAGRTMLQEAQQSRQGLRIWGLL